MTAVLDTLLHGYPSIPIFLYFEQSHQRWAGSDFDVWHQVVSPNLSFSFVERKSDQEW